ncbi:hypothetical protein HK405_010523 [Cladochytrium tenue]|nr:hypothetical protein HK405_010523 [Cladochytrium tenue]
MATRVDGLVARHRQELADRMREKEDELQMVEDRVREALAAKDDAAGRLRVQLDEMVLRNETLTELIEKQRAELLG